MKIIKVRDSKIGLTIAKNLLYRNCNNKTTLFLSGGSTPKGLYKLIAKEKKLKVGAVALIDERFEDKMHDNSNEKMIKDTNLLAYFEDKKIRFYPILKDKDIEQTTKDYDETLRYLFNHFPKNIGILGIGEDGHTAGIPAIEKFSKEILNDKTSLVRFYEDKNSFYKQRITSTFIALQKLDLIIILAFGKPKKKALTLMFEKGNIGKIPARFYNQNNISSKTILITDQKL
ncbi:MAG: 6-phosphogluconolactonase [Candidatus Levybacteria bacterium]|nr:6-phosphogluconolactonase [Candidatus Levybacteria bacterium]